MTIGSVALYSYLPDHPFGIQAAAAVCYTFTIVLFILTALLALAQILTNRSLLDRAHNDAEKP